MKEAVYEFKGERELFPIVNFAVFISSNYPMFSRALFALALEIRRVLLFWVIVFATTIKILAILFHQLVHALNLSKIDKIAPTRKAIYPLANADLSHTNEKARSALS